MIFISFAARRRPWTKINKRKLPRILISFLLYPLIIKRFFIFVFRVRRVALAVTENDTPFSSSFFWRT